MFYINRFRIKVTILQAAIPLNATKPVLCLRIGVLYIVPDKRLPSGVKMQFGIFTDNNPFK